MPSFPSNRRLDRGRSTYDRPHRFAFNGVYELPFHREQKGFMGRVLGGWQISGFLTLQSGAPFSPINGPDPGFRLISLAIERGVPVVPIPGPAAFLTALVASGFPTEWFSFRGFLPAKMGLRL